MQTAFDTAQALEVPELDLGVEELDEMLDPINWGDFFGGVSIGIGLVGLYAAGAAIAT